MRRLRDIIGGSLIALGIAVSGAGSAQAVEIEYWQYVFDTRVKAMNRLIEEFQAANPGITVKHTTFPYADYQTKVIASASAGIGPDVVQLFYGWVDLFVNAKLVQPLPKDTFPTDAIEKDFFPIVQAMKRNGEYYALPTAVRSLALFYNKKLFQEAGLDSAKPPQTLTELVDAAKKTVKMESGNMVSAGITMDMAGQDHQWWREVLVRQFGGVPYSDDYRKVTYNDKAGADALKFYTDLQTGEKVGQMGFMDEGQAAFRAGRAAMTIDGTFRIGSFKTIKDFEWGVAELPANAEGLRSNYASYWTNAITAKAKGEKLEAAKKFLAFVSSPKAMELWLDSVGELPARREVAQKPEYIDDPVYGPFLKALDYSKVTLFVDEQAQRQITMDMTNRVLIQGQEPQAAIDQAAKEEQALIDRVAK